jgi:hypothetical protein
MEAELLRRWKGRSQRRAGSETTTVLPQWRNPHEPPTLTSGFRVLGKFPFGFSRQFCAVKCRVLRVTNLGVLRQGLGFSRLRSELFRVFVCLENWGIGRDCLRE